MASLRVNTVRNKSESESHEAKTGMDPACHPTHTVDTLQDIHSTGHSVSVDSTTDIIPQRPTPR